MDLIENPELRETYDKYKLTVKCWECKFKKKYGRLPSKVSKVFFYLRLLEFNFYLSF